MLEETANLDSHSSLPTFKTFSFPAAFAMAQANRNPAAHPWHDLPIQAEVTRVPRENSGGERGRGREKRESKRNRVVLYQLEPKKKTRTRNSINLQGGPPCPQVINAVVEIGRGSKVKYELDKVRSAS